jgi:hypothetical protein
MPVKVLNTDDTEFYGTAHIKKYKPRAASLKIDSLNGLNALEEPFKGLFMYAYARRFTEQTFSEGFFNDNPIFGELVKYLRNLPKNMAKQTACHILSHAGAMAGKEYARTALSQLMFIAPDISTLKLIGQTKGFGGSAVMMLDMLGLSGNELYNELGEADFNKLVSALTDVGTGDIFYHVTVADKINDLLQNGNKIPNDCAVYLNYAYLSHNYKLTGINQLTSISLASERSMSADVEMRFLSGVLNSKLERREFDKPFKEAFEKFWTLSDMQSQGSHRDEAHRILWRMLALGDCSAYTDFLPYFQNVSNAGKDGSSAMYEYLLYNKIINGRSVTQDEAEHMLRLYNAQLIVTARTKKVAAAIGAEKFIKEGLIVFEWIETDPAWTDVEAAAADYLDLIDKDINTAGITAQPVQNVLNPNVFTYVFNVGYTDCYSIKYTSGDRQYTGLIRRDIAADPLKRAFIFEKAWDYIDKKAGSSVNFLLLAGRVCIDNNFFEADVLFAYIEYLNTKPEMRAEMVRILLYVLNSRNALTKACLYAPPASKISEMLKRFYSTCFAFWQDVKKKTDVRGIFAYVKCLERIVGKHRLGGLREYLIDQILHNPNIKPDLSEEFKAMMG